MTWWVIEGTGHEPGFTDLHVHATTNFPDHLFMSWSTYEPAQHEVWKNVRGTQVFCGYQYIWDTPNIAEQKQSGDTLFHSFYISGIETRPSVWYYLHAPGGPFGQEIQGPLMHVLLLRLPHWTVRAYFASRTKGMFKTTDFSQPGGPQPTWVPDNAGLPFLDIRAACPDPADPYHSRFIICHGDVYRMENIFIDEPALATRVLSNAEAVALTGASPGRLLCIANSPRLNGHFFVGFCSNTGGTGIWCLKTTDYGLSWTAHLIDNSIWSWSIGNIMHADQGPPTPFHPRDVLYCAINIDIGGVLYVCWSIDEGESWARTLTRPSGFGLYEPRLHVDPTDHSIVYVSGAGGGQDLWRTTDYGATWALSDQGNSLRVIISPLANSGTMGTHHSDPDQIRVLSDLHIWKSSDFGDIWRDQGLCQYSTRHLHFKPFSYDWLYLARITDAPAPGALYARHVIFVSTDEGSNMYGKAGAHADQADGAGDSIPWNCGGVAIEGLLTLP